MTCRRWIPVVLLLSLAQLCAANESFQLTAIRYGVSTFPESSVFWDGDPEKQVEFHWLFYVLRIPNRIVLIDTGFFDKRMAKTFKVDLQDPVALLQRMGISPRDVTDIVVTHGHFDHLGNVDRFPLAQVWIQDSALKYALTQPYSADFLQFLGHSPRVHRLKGDVALWDTLSFHVVEGHSRGSSAIYLGYPEPRVILTGDESYLDENWQTVRPTGSLLSFTADKNFLELLLDLKTKKGVEILTMHDPRVLKGRTQADGPTSRVIWDFGESGNRGP